MKVKGCQRHLFSSRNIHKIYTCPMCEIERLKTAKRRLERELSLAHSVCNEAIGWVRWTEEHKKCNLRNLVVILSKFWGWKPKKKRGAKK